MFLSGQVSRLESDGGLTIDLGSRGGPKLRFGPLASGMPWERWENGHWVPTDHDYGVLLVNKAHESRKSLPVLDYLLGLPKDVLELFYGVRWLQATMLQLWARWPQARDLMQSNFALFCLVSLEYAASPDRRHLIIDALGRRQRHLLALILRQHVRAAQVRSLRRVVFDVGNRNALLNLCRFVADEDRVMAFRHWSKLPTSLLSLFLEAPFLAEFQPLRTQVDAASRSWEFEAIAEERGRLLHDTLRLARMLQPKGFGAQVIPRYRSWARIDRLHDQMLRAAETLGWRALLDSGIKVEQQLCKPPIPAAEGFAPIETVADLVAESAAMSHCVLVRARDAIEGLAAIYRVEVAGERGTLEISLGDEMEPLTIEQFKLACNKEPSREAWDAADKWFAEGRSAWIRRAATRI